MKARIITLLIAIVALLGSATAQETEQKKVINLYQGGEVIQEYNVGDVDSIKFELKGPIYRIKDVASGKYMNAANYDSHADASVGGVNCIDYAESDDQIFTFTKSGSNYILTTLSGYNIVCQSWNVDALKTSGTALTFVDNGDGTYCIKNGSKYFKVELVNGAYYPYCDAEYSQRATWKLEEVVVNNAGGDTAPDCTVSVTSVVGGIATVTLNSLAQGYTLTATPAQDYNFVNWTVNGEVVSTSNPYTATITANSEFVANFEKETYTVSVSATTGGIATASSSSVEKRGRVTLTATSNEGYEFVNWTVNGKVVSTSNPYTATITANSEFVANFEKSEWFRLKNVNNGYYLSFTNHDSYTTNSRDNAGMGVVAYAESSEDQLFRFEDGDNGKFYIVSKSGYYIYCTYWQCHAHQTLKTQFTVEKSGNYYTIYQAESLNQGETAYGYLAPQAVGSGKIVYCDNAASNGYKTWEVGGISNIFTVSVNTNDETMGTATASSSIVEMGGSVTLTAKPNSGYVFKNWTVNGEVVSTSNSYTATITADSEFVANFEKKIEWFRLKNVNNGYYLSFTNHDSYTTNSRDNAGMGVVAYAESSEDQLFRFEDGDNGKFYIVSKSGYYIYCTYWQCHAHQTLKTQFTVEKSGNYYTIYQAESLDQGKAAYGYLAPQTEGSGKIVYCDNAASNGYKTWSLVGGGINIFTVSVNTNDETMGTATASSSSVEKGGSVTLTATPNSGYVFKNWTLNGEIVSTKEIYKATVTANSEFVANFEKITYTVSVSATTGGIATASSSRVEKGGSVTLTATPNEDYVFVNWTVNGVEVSKTNPYTATITADTEFKANFLGKCNGHEYVDLGLPSGLKWATCNVGANSPEEYGDYFAWGETEPKDYYNWRTYKYCNGTYDTMTKYCTNSNYGVVDNKTTLELTDDAARVNWGGKWRMPTKAEQDELRENCTWEWTTQNGVNGYKVTSKVNRRNSIFLPAAGCRLYENLSDAGSNGYYWSSSLSTSLSLSEDACYLYFYSGNVYGNDINRCDGQSVRAVFE